MTKKAKTTKTVRKKNISKKKINQDKDFFTFEDDYEDDYLTDKYEADWNNHEYDNQQEEIVTTKTTYKVEDKGNDIYIEEEKNNEELLHKLNKHARRILRIIIIIAILIVIDLFLITRFEFGPLFAIRTKTHNDGGTKEYYGLGYKVIRYNVTNGRSGLVVGHYSLKYSPNPKKVDLSKKKLTEDNNGDYVEITGKVKKIDKKNKRVVLQNGNNKIYCDMKDEFKAYNKISTGKSINIRGRIYIETNNKLYLENGVVK